MTPDGRFGVPIEPGSARTLVAFAAGSGITPVMAILKTVLRREAGRFFLFYGNRTSADIIFREQLEDLKDRYLARLSVFHVLSREQQDIAGAAWPSRSGEAAAADAVHGADGRRGPGVRLRAAADDRGAGKGTGATSAWRATASMSSGSLRGSAAGRVRSSVAPAAKPKAIATVISEGVRSDIPVAEGEAIIDAAIRAGRSLPYSCKGGMCCTCRAGCWRAGWKWR